MRLVHALLFGVLSFASAESVQAPLKMRVNTEVFEKAFHARDQEVFKVLQDHPVSTTEGSAFGDVSVSLKP